MADEEVDRSPQTLAGVLASSSGVAHPEIGEVVERTWPKIAGAVPSVRLRVEDVGVPERVDGARRTEHAIRVPNVEGEEANDRGALTESHYFESWAMCRSRTSLAFSHVKSRLSAASQRGGELARRYGRAIERPRTRERVLRWPSGRRLQDVSELRR